MVTLKQQYVHEEKYIAEEHKYLQNINIAAASIVKEVQKLIYPRKICKVDH